MRLLSDWSRNDYFMKLITGIVREAAEAALKANGGDVSDAEVGFLIADDESMQRLNRDYRGIDAPTDVLAFSMREGLDGDLHPELLGDLAISVPTADRQASAQGHSLAHEVTVLAVHGTLHLLGYDDETDEGAQGMADEVGAVTKALWASPTWQDRAAHVAALVAEVPA